LARSEDFAANESPEEISHFSEGTGILSATLDPNETGRLDDLLCPVRVDPHIGCRRITRQFFGQIANLND
jgi:hypothetical protein